MSATSIRLTDGTVVGGRSGDVTITSTKTHPKGRGVVDDCGGAAAGHEIVAPFAVSGVGWGPVPW